MPSSMTIPPYLEKSHSQEPAKKRQRRGTPSPARTDTAASLVLESGVFWDIENMPVKIDQAAKRVPEIKLAMTNFITNVNHYNDEFPVTKNIRKFMAVARQKGRNTPATTAECIKARLVDNQIELLDLPYSADPDYCDDAIYQSVLCFIEDHGKSMVVALTGDVGLVQRINLIERDFDLVVIMQRAGKKISVMERHCDKIKQTNERGRQQTVYFLDEVIRKCLTGGVPQTFSQLLRLKRERNKDVELDEDHFGLLFSEEYEPTRGRSNDSDYDSGYDSDMGSDSDSDSDSDDARYFSCSESSLFGDIE